MATRLSTAARNAAADAIAALADDGSIEIRSGSQPASAQDTASGDLLATITLADPAFGSATSGVATLADTPLTATGADAGTAGYFRMKDGSGATVMDGSVTATGGGGQLELNTTTISVGVTISITSGTITMPAGT